MAREWGAGQLWPDRLRAVINEFGQFALWLALALSLGQTVFGLVGRLRRDPAFSGAAEGEALAGFLGHRRTGLRGPDPTPSWFSDFSVLNVAANSHTAKPLLYKVAGAWGSHEGSMLLWCLMLTGYGAAIVIGGRALPWRLRASTVTVQGALGLLFIAYMVLASNPLARLETPPVEGRSLNPLLQDPALAFHPPFLYAGYVGLSVVFSMSLAALAEGKADAAWARWVRPWTLAAWSLR